MRSTFVNRVNSRTGTQRVIPDIHFTCNGTITKWIIGGLTGRNGENNLLELQVWRSNVSENVTFIRTTTSVVNNFNATDDKNVYEYIPKSPLEVQEGDILGFFQPEQSMLNMYVQPNGGPLNYGASNMLSSSLTVINLESSLLNQNDYPLISAVISKSAIVSFYKFSSLSMHVYFCR